MKNYAIKYIDNTGTHWYLCEAESEEEAKQVFENRHAQFHANNGLYAAFGMSLKLDILKVKAWAL